jgi:hypothetical protein
MSVKIKDSSELDYEMAMRAAERIVKICQDADFTPPEAMDLHLEKIRQICTCIDSIADGLRLRPGGRFIDRCSKETA